MLRDEYLRRLIDGAHIELYLSASGGSGGRVYWPWKMNPPKEALPRMRNSCEKYIIDSDIEDPSISNKDSLDAAFKYDAEIAALADYMPFNYYKNELHPVNDKEAWDAFQDLKREYDSAYEATLDSLESGLEIYHGHPFDGKLLIPLQEPWVECWHELGEPTEHLIGIGGLKESTPEKRLTATRNVRDAVGEDVWIHGFGWGVQGLSEHIRANPNLLDSLDYSSPVQNAMNDVETTPGEEVSSVIAMDMATQLVRDLREVSEYPREAEPEDLRGENQASLF